MFFKLQTSFGNDPEEMTLLFLRGPFNFKNFGYSLIVQNSKSKENPKKETNSR